MPTSLTSAAVGALVREARLAAGLSQTDLGQRIGASRFWVAQFEKGKPSAELGLALKAIHTLGLTLHIEPVKRIGERTPPAPKAARTTLGQIIARNTLSHVAPSTVVGSPTESAPSPRPRKR